MPPVRMLGLLMLMFFQCAGADSTCPAEENPLTLDPLEVIGEYQTSVTVNCSTSNENYNDMFLRFGDTEHSADGDPAVDKPLSLSDWNITAECRIKVDSFDCSKHFKITIYKNPAAVIMFDNVTSVVEGKLYSLQCDVHDVAPAQNLTVTWYKDNKTIHTESFNHITDKTPLDVSTFLNISLSRGEDGAQFKCEAQLDLGPYVSPPPAVSDIHKFSVHYAPELKIQDTEYERAYEGDTVTLNCAAEGNPPPVFNWTGGGVNILESTGILNITVNTSTTYICTAANSLGTKTKKIYVRMLQPFRVATPAAMTTPTASAPRDCPLSLTPDEVVVRFGDKVSVFCNTSETDVAGMGWEVSTKGTGFTAGATALNWTVEKLEEWDIKPWCYITLNNGFQCNCTPDITLYKTPDAVSVSADHREMEEGREYLLNCNITNVAPVQNLTVKWYRGNETVHTHRVSETSVTPVSVSSTFRVTADRDLNRALFRCEAELQLGPKGPESNPTETSLPYTAVVLYEPLIQDCPGHLSGVEHEFSLERMPCHADANPAPTVQWYYQGKPIDASMKFNRTHSGKFTVQVENDLGSTNTSVDITVEYSPSFACSGSYKVQEDAEHQTLCEPEGIPKPDVIWYKDGKVKGTPQRWRKTDSGEYLLRASNKHGRAEHRLSLNVLYAPVFMEGNYTKEVAQGGNVTFECRAEGNPAPVIQWNFTSAVNVKMTTWGRQGNITITGATSTNAGVYICVATNEIGSVTRSVKLLMKGKTSGIPLWFIWALIIILIICVVIILICIYCHRWKKHGQYSFVPGKDIPLTTKSDGA